MIEDYMTLALKEAKKAYDINEVPVGCIIVKDDEIIASAFNMRETTNNVLAHAETLAIDKACKKLGSWRLEECDIYVTLEPCIMCFGAMIQARVKNLYFGAYDKKAGVATHLLNVKSAKFNHYINVKGGIMEKECADIISDFFSKLREEKNGHIATDEIL